MERRECYLLHSFQNVRRKTFLNSEASLYWTKFMGIFFSVSRMPNENMETFRGGSNGLLWQCWSGIFFLWNLVKHRKFNFKKIHLRTRDSYVDWEAIVQHYYSTAFPSLLATASYPPRLQILMCFYMVYYRTHFE